MRGKNMGNTKERTLAVERIIAENKQVTMRNIKDILFNLYGIEADRRSIYDDINALTKYMPITTQNKFGKFYYCLEPQS